jgi:NAD(P)-dependent dehydrogenase (short-subunit alcohol dehydrogenase family)
MARSRGGDGGAIVNVGSQAAKFGGDRLCAYAAAKAGLHTLTVSLARELAPEGIRVNAVSPGVIATDQQRGLPPQRLAGLQASLPLGRMGEPEEVAEAIMWLLSDSASYVTGAVLSVSGGR